MFCIVNVVNEVVVVVFFCDEISFFGMSDVIEYIMGQVFFVQIFIYDDYVVIDVEVCWIVCELICK